MPNNDEEVLVSVGAKSNVDAGLSEAADRLKSVVDEMTANLERLGESSRDTADKMETAGKSIGDAFEDASSHTDKSGKAMEDSFGAIAKAVGGLTLIVEKAKKSFDLLFTVIGGGLLVHAMEELGAKSANYANEILRASEKTGIGTDRLQELRYAAEANHVSFGALQVSMQRLSSQMEAAGNGSKTAVARFNELGISANEIKGLGLDGVLERMADRFQLAANSSGKMTVASQMLGRGGRELIPLLNQGSDGLKRMSDEFRNMGGVMSHDALDQANKLNNQIHELHTTNEILERVISSALVPAFIAITRAFIDAESKGGLFTRVVEGIGLALRAATIVISYFVEGVWIAYAALKGFYDLAHHPLDAAYIFEQWHREMDKMASGMDKFRADVMKPPSASSQVGTDVIKSPGTASSHDERLAQWREALEKLKEEEGYFHEYSKTQEAQYWQDKLALIDTGTKAGLKLYQQVDHLRYQAARGAAQEEEAARQVEVKTKIDAERNNLAAQLALMVQNAEQIKKLYGEDSKEYKAQLKEQLDQKRKINEEIAKLEEITVNATKKRIDANIALEQSANDFSYTMQQISLQQKLSADVQYENRHYQIAVDAVKKRMDIERAAGTLTYEGERQLLDQIADLNIAHEQKLLALKQQSMQEAAKYQLEAVQETRDSFATLFSDIAKGSKGAKKSLDDFFSGLNSKLLDTAGKKLTEQLMGPGTQGGGFLNDIFGSLFGTQKGDAGATGATAANAALMSLATAAQTNTPIMLAIASAGEAQNVSAALVSTAFTALTTAATSAAAALAAVGVAGGASAGVSAASTGMDVIGFANGIPPMADGTNYVPRDMYALIHAGEAVVPAKYNSQGAIGGMSQTNHFHVQGDISTKTQDQIALRMGQAMSRATNRIG